MKNFTPLSISLLSAILAVPSAWAQASVTTVPQLNAPSTEASTAGVNPMTGRPLSEEDLSRQLNKSKLLTQLGQEQVKQAQNAADLALANLRVDAEKTRARAETFAQIAASGGARSAGVTVFKPIPVATGALSRSLGAGKGIAPPAAQSSTREMPTTLAQPVSKATGTIRIGGETLDVSSSAPPATPAQVQWVDSQTRQVARAGSPLQPISIQPATGVLGIPAIPGIMPAMPLPVQFQ